MNIRVELNSRAVAGQFRRMIGARIDPALKAIEDHARARVPVDEGELRDSSDREARPGELEGEVSFLADHADVVEFGTSTHIASPFLRPALYEHAGEYLKILANGPAEVTTDE